MGFFLREEPNFLKINTGLQCCFPVFLVTSFGCISEKEVKMATFDEIDFVA